MTPTPPTPLRPHEGAPRAVGGFPVAVACTGHPIWLPRTPSAELPIDQAWHKVRITAGVLTVVSSARARPGWTRSQAERAPVRTANSRTPGTRAGA